MNVSETVIQIHKWLHTTGIDLKCQHDFVDAYCCMLREEVGIPMDRFYCGASVLHPLVGMRAWKWMEGTITDFEYSRKAVDSVKNLGHLPENTSGDSRRDPPMVRLMAGEPSVRIRASDEVIPSDCEWMINDGYTDLFCLPTPRSGDGDELEGGFTWSTKAAGGFTDDHIEVLQQTLLALATALRFQIMRFTSKSLLKMYLGEDAGARVFGGEIQRGEGLTIRSVVWFSDIRGFTQLSGELKRVELVNLINDVFEVTADVIKEHKGQTLKFIGDGLMAVFSSTTKSFQRSSFTADEKRDLDAQAAELCRSARLAATEVQRRLATLKQERESQGLRGASVGIGLHYGDVSYGNVGAPERLDFTVLGSSVNLASRTESLCSKLGAKVLCTEDFVRLDGDLSVWTSRGEHQVKGVKEPVHIYELDSPLRARRKSALEILKGSPLTERELMEPITDDEEENLRTRHDSGGGGGEKS